MTDESRRSAGRAAGHPPRQIEAVVCDAGGVLLHPSLDWIAGELTRVGVKRTVDQLHAAYYRMAYAADQSPALDPHGVALSSLEVRRWMMQQMLRGTLPSREIDPAAEAVARRAADVFPGESDIFHWAMPGLRGRLEGLQRAGFRLAVASNNDGSLAAQLTRVGVADLFEVSLDSGVEGVAKPDPELLTRACQRLGVAPERCLYVGDIDRVDGEAARAAGMRFALLDPLRQPRASRPLIIASLDEIPRRFAENPPHTTVEKHGRDHV